MRIPFTGLPCPALFSSYNGAIIVGYCFLYMYGEMQEKNVKTIQMQAEQIADLKKEKDIWQEDFKKLNEKNKKLLTVQDISVKIMNPKKYRIDPLSVFEVEESIKEDMNSLLAKDINEVYNNIGLIERLIENKPVKINERRYRLVIKNSGLYDHQYTTGTHTGIG